MSKIEWTGRTWTPVVGCSLVSPGCTNCYAMGMAHRIQKLNPTGGSGTDYVNHYDGTTKVVNGKPVWTGKLVRAPDKLFNLPLRTRKPTTWFVNSMSDLFHENVPDECIDRVFAVMALCPHHTFQVLTKRSARMLAYCKDRNTPVRIARYLLDNMVLFRGVAEVLAALGNRADEDDPEFVIWPLQNAWLGVSAEDQKRADERIPDLLATPAAVRFVSAEPLLGPLYLKRYLIGHEEAGMVGNCIGWTPPLDWVIVGGESGPGARPFDIDWARDIVWQCGLEEVACFVKQVGAHPVDSARPCAPQDRPLRLKGKDKKGGDPAEWPGELRVRQLPVPASVERQSETEHA